MMIDDITFLFDRLRKVKMDQRKLMDNASTITDMAKVKTILLVVKRAALNLNDNFLLVRRHKITFTRYFRMSTVDRTSWTKE